MKPSKQKESSGSYLKEVRRRLHGHLELVYPEQDLDILCDRFIRAMGLDNQCDKPRWHKNNWNEEDIAVITYANSFLKEGEKPLATLQRFLTSQLELSLIHI